MMSEKDMYDFARKLLERTLANEVNWRPGDGQDESCDLFLKSTLISVGKTTNFRQRGPFFWLRFYAISDESTGVYKTLGSVEMYAGSIDSSSSSAATSISEDIDRKNLYLLQDLFEAASKRVVKLDDALAEIRSALSNNQPVGIPESVTR